MIEVDTVKGFSDYLLPESLKRRKIKKIVVKWFERFGFVPIETPIVEYDDLMRGDALPSEGEDEAISDRFRLTDKGGRNLGLRYEFTFQLGRIFKQNPNIKLPFKRYQIGSVFRDEPIRAGRTREFTQCDVDIVGDSSVNAEAETLAVMTEILKEVGVKNYSIEVNSRALLQEVIESVEIKDIKPVMREIDKLDKIGEDAVKANLKKYTTPNQIITLFKLLEKDLRFFSDNNFSGAEELESLIETLGFYGIKVKFNPTMVRGLGYYTGNIFEFYTPKKNTIMGGGRYDASVGKFSNKEISAVGISFSIEALMGLFPEEVSKLESESLPKLLIISISQEKPAIVLAGKLRKRGVKCTLSFDKPGKAMEYANSYKIPFVVFVGQEEVGNKKFKLKDMVSGKEQLMGEAQLIKALSK